MKRVLVAHPSKQHSNRTAAALEKGGVLAAYLTGYPCLEKHVRALPPFIRRRLFAYENTGIMERKVRWNPSALLARKAGAVFGHAASAWFEYGGNRLFDRWAAAWIDKAGCDIVLGYETASEALFRRAKLLGKKTVLDAASIHYTAQDWFRESGEPVRLHSLINAVKEREIEAADMILAASDFAAETYARVLRSSRKIRVLPLGVDRGVFRPSAPDEEKGAPFRILFAGAVSRHKRADMLAEIFLTDMKDVLGAELAFAGPPGDAFEDVVKASEADGRIKYLGALSRDHMALEMARADLLVLFSKFESFGLVAAEAMACGTPVLVSSTTGIKQFVREGVNGWVVEHDSVAGFRACLRKCAADRERVIRMRRETAARSEEVSWETYGRRLLEILEELI